MMRFYKSHLLLLLLLFLINLKRQTYWHHRSSARVLKRVLRSFYSLNPRWLPDSSPPFLYAKKGNFFQATCGL